MVSSAGRPEHASVEHSGAAVMSTPEAGRPIRVQLRRTRGWRLPPNTVVVARPTRWGNPFAVVPGFRDRATALALYAQLVDELGEPFAAQARHHLAGRDLACWCPPGQPCHADTLLALANNTEPTTVDGDGRRG